MTKMADETLREPLVSSQDRDRPLSSEQGVGRPFLSDQDGGRLPPMCRPHMGGMDGNCGGAACPWTTKDAEGRSEDMKKLSRAVVFCLLFMLVEVVGGIQAGSLAILTDAAHLLSDVASFAISLFAMWAGGWEANARQSYGFFRVEILGALVSIQIIWLITGIILYEAFARLFGDSVPIDGRLMFIIAALGLVVNLGMMFILEHGHNHGHGHGGHSHGSSHGSHSHGKEHSHGHGESQHSHDHSEEGHRHHDGDNHNHEHGHEPNLDDEQQATEDLDVNPQRREDRLSLTSSGRLDSREALVLRQDGHNTECVRTNVSRRPRSASGDTIVMCICDEVEQEENQERSFRVTIDQGADHENHGDSHYEGSINVRGAYLHVLGDLIQSIGVMIGGAVIWWKPNWLIVDLICTFLFSILVLGTTIKMIRDILDVLMESTPREIDPRALQSGLMEIDGVKEVHELHIWAITVGKVVLACHVMVDPDADSDKLLAEVIKYCDKKYKISHVTVQIERLSKLQKHLDG